MTCNVRLVAGFVSASVVLTALGQSQAKKESGKAAEPAAQAATVGKPAPDFTLTDFDGKTWKLSDLKGKVVVLEWINFDCPVSLKCNPTMKTTSEKYAGQGVVWLAIDSTNFHKAADNAQFVKDRQLSYKILSDFDGTVGHTYAARTTPHMFVVNKEGVIAYAGAIDDQKDRNYVAEALDAVIAGKTVAVSETKPYGCPVKYKK